jgi:hypothetical protein
VLLPLPALFFSAFLSRAILDFCALPPPMAARGGRAGARGDREGEPARGGGAGEEAVSGEGGGQNVIASSGEARCGRKGWGPACGVVVVEMVVEVAAVDGQIRGRAGTGESDCTRRG